MSLLALGFECDIVTEYSFLSIKPGQMVSRAAKISKPSSRRAFDVALLSLNFLVQSSKLKASAILSL